MHTHTETAATEPTTTTAPHGINSNDWRALQNRWYTRVTKL